VPQKKTISTPFKRLRPPISYEKTDVEWEASTRLEVEKWMTSFKKSPPPKKSAKELEAKGKMLRCLVEPKKPMPLDYKCTIMNAHYAKRSDENLENEDEQMIKFYQGVGLSLEQLHGQSKIQMAYASKAWVVGEPMSMRNVSIIVHKQDFCTSGTYNKLREVDSCLDFNAITNISTMVMVSSGLCGIKCIAY
jgi:hypothetical protein